MDPRMTEAGMHELVTQLRTHALQRWILARDRQEYVCAAPEGAREPVDAALTVLESDLSYLEDLPGDRIASAGGALEEMDERLKRLLGALERPAP